MQPVLHLPEVVTSELMTLAAQLERKIDAELVRHCPALARCCCASRRSLGNPSQPPTRGRSAMRFPWHASCYTKRQSFACFTNNTQAPISPTKDEPHRSCAHKHINIWGSAPTRYVGEDGISPAAEQQQLNWLKFGLKRV
jgi:hypothetical protein